MANLILSEVKDDIGIITLNRPDRYNSLVPDLLVEFIQCFSLLENDPSAKVIIFKANGPVFSTGGDLQGFKDHFNDIEAYSQKLVGLLNQSILAILKSKLPVVCEVHGMVTGGSLGFVLASDIVLITPKTTFTPYYSVVGFCPDGGWTAMLPSIIGKKRTAQILMCNDTITAVSAIEWGMANRLVPDESLHSEAVKVAQKMISKKQGSIDETKQLLNFDMEETAKALDRELIGFFKRVRTKEAQNGILEFLNGKS